MPGDRDIAEDLAAAVLRAAGWHLTPPPSDETAQIIEAAHRVSKRMGAVFTIDPRRLEVFRRATPTHQQGPACESGCDFCPKCWADPTGDQRPGHADDG